MFHFAANLTVTLCSQGSVINIGMLSVADLVEFSDEEGYGKFLDLHECYVKFINLKGIEVQTNAQSVIYR